MRLLLVFLSCVSSALAVDFQRDIVPILTRHCNDCHSTKRQKGDLDLERFASLGEVKKHPMIWEQVLEQLATNEMPPKDEPPLSQQQKEQLADWVRTMLNEIALANAGDPGPVVLRRLSNMEYTYTLRDLTGVESLDPAKEFPVDGAAGEGFTNVGAGLVMSPALLTKYLDAAKEIASHAVLLPDGIRFSQHTSQQDWTEETLASIRRNYARHTESTGVEELKVPGAKVVEHMSGRLPVGRYLDALQGRTGTAGLNGKYMGILRQALMGTTPSTLFDPLRTKFRAKSLTAADIAAWQQVLWRFASVGHIGKENGPKAWQEPVTPLVARQEMRVKLAGGEATTLYLTTTDAGDGNEGDAVVWENPRLMTAQKADKPGEDAPTLITKLGDHLEAKAPSVIELKISAGHAADAEFVVTGRLATGSTGSVQMQVLTAKPPSLQPGLIPGGSSSALVKGTWSDNNLQTRHGAPVIAVEGSAAWRRHGDMFAEFRALFPIALCYTKIVPADEVVTLTLFHREDEPLRRLMLDAAETEDLDRLWDELIFVSEAPLKQVDVFEQLYQFATQDAKPAAFEPMREPILQGAEAFKIRQKTAVAKQVEAVIDFAAKAWRRPLTDKEIASLTKLQVPVRLLLARVLASSAFLYRGEKAGEKTGLVDDHELATRLSYFLWSSTPDEELRELADSGRLSDPEVLASQTRRMLKDAKIRRLATEFGCQWLHVRDVETLEEKSERHFPTFASLRGDMQEEVVRFFVDLSQENCSVLSLLDADHTFVNAALAGHYALDSKPADWARVEGWRSQGRGGILGFAATLAKQSGASRTSPILRGNWLAEVVLGDRLPRPPKDVPILPDEAPADLTERQLIERHSSDAKCAGCHQRIDPFGFALEGFDAIGRVRKADTQAVLPDGTSFTGLEGLRAYLLTTRLDDFLRQFCRKLLGYSLGRSVQLSDQPLIETMLKELQANDHRIGTAVELIVRSPQFRQVRGRDFITTN